MKSILYFKQWTLKQDINNDTNVLRPLLFAKVFKIVDFKTVLNIFSFKILF